MNALTEDVYVTVVFFLGNPYKFFELNTGVIFGIVQLVTSFNLLALTREPHSSIIKVLAVFSTWFRSICASQHSESWRNRLSQQLRVRRLVLNFIFKKLWSDLIKQGSHVTGRSKNFKNYSSEQSNNNESDNKSDSSPVTSIPNHTLSGDPWGE